jgi:hypothetical protein
VSPQMIEERAREIARSDGRAQPNDLDRICAREELIAPTSGSEQPATRKEPGQRKGLRRAESKKSKLRGRMEPARPGAA